MSRKVLIALVLFVCGQTMTAQPERDCVRFATERLLAGQAFSAPLQFGLAFRLTPINGVWRVAVGRVDDSRADYLAPVSPPYRSAPHLVIGSAYGLTARESVHISPRELHFVFNRHDAQLAWDIASAALLGDIHRWKDIDKIPKGTLTFRITDAQADDEAVEWIALAGEACVPANQPPAAE